MILILTILFTLTDDRDGKCLRELLQHGHDAHCGWKNNGCPTDFLKYPTRSFESLNIEMLQRTRLTLLAIIDFAKRNEGQPANTLMISNASISATTPSSSTSSTSSSKLMRVQVASVIRDTVPDHANWFLLSNASSSSDSTLSSSSIQFSLAECVQSESLLKIASVVKCIDRQIKAYSVGYNVFVGSEEGMDKESQENPLAILDSLLRPISQNIDGTANNSFNSVSIQQIVKTSILMAVTGWTPIATTTTVSLNNTSNTNTIRAEGVVIDGVLIGGRMESSMDSFKCNMCGRCFPLKYLLSDTAVDPLFQHRSFCLWAQYRNDTTTNNIDSKSEEFVSQNDISCEPGWMHCVNAIMNKTSGVSPLILDSVSRRSSLENRVNIDRNGGEISSMALGDGLEYRENAEQVYKKIKLVLDLASTPRIPQQGRFSL